MFINHKEIVVFTFLTCASICAFSEEDAPMTILERSMKYSGSPEEEKIEIPVVEIVEPETERPYLIKVIIPYTGKSKAIATISFNGALTPYRVGDFMEPNYYITNIKHNQVSLNCSTDDKSKCKFKNLSISSSWK